MIILSDGESLGLNELQFAYQVGSSTVMCTWAALETIDYFLKNGSEVYTCATDMSKAFDLTLHSLMFTNMLDAGVSPILVRLLIHVYAYQEANVRWNGKHSPKFSVKNGLVVAKEKYLQQLPTAFIVKSCLLSFAGDILGAGSGATTWASLGKVMITGFWHLHCLHCKTF